VLLSGRLPSSRRAYPLGLAAGQGGSRLPQADVAHPTSTRSWSFERMAGMLAKKSMALVHRHVQDVGDAQILVADVPGCRH
jgi:hypothetical protein